MKRHGAVFVAVLLILSAGCGVLRNAPKRSIVGTWIGKGVVGHGGVRQVWDVTLTMNADGTFVVVYDIGGKNRKELKGKYSTVLSRHPAFIDIVFEFPNNVSYCCPAIAEFPAADKMNICGLIGQCGEVARPATFNRNPSNNHQLYHELTKKE